METTATYHPNKIVKKNCSPFSKRYHVQKENEDFLLTYSVNLEKILKEEFKKQKAFKK
jgi:hypothetical protein